MFTGLIEEVATLERMELNSNGAHLHLRATKVLENVRLGDSIAVHGVCLTVVQFTATRFTADAVPETLRRSTLGRLEPGDTVNVERALRVGDRFGGHIVAGHVDGIGRVTDVAQEGIARVITVEADDQVLRYVVEKGSICIDGVSLTVMDVSRSHFRVSIIPHTAGHTTLDGVRRGHLVNLECDVVAKYVEKLVKGYAPSTEQDGRLNGSGAMSQAWLAENGFA